MARSNQTNLLIDGRRVFCVFRTASGPLCRQVGQDTGNRIPETVVQMAKEGDPWEDADVFLRRHRLRRDQVLIEKKPRKAPRKDRENAIAGKW